MFRFSLSVSFSLSLFIYWEGCNGGFEASECQVIWQGLGPLASTAPAALGKNSSPEYERRSRVEARAIVHLLTCLGGRPTYFLVVLYFRGAWFALSAWIEPHMFQCWAVGDETREIVCWI